MNLKVFYIGLLGALVMATTQTEGMQRMQNAARIEKDLEEHKAAVHAVQPHIDLAGHGNNPAAAAQDIVDNLGVHPGAPTGVTANHKVADLNTRLGTKAHAPTGPSAHEKLTDLMAIQGAITNTHTAQGANSGHVGPNANDLAGTAIKNEEAIFARLKAGIAALNANGGQYEWRALSATKTTNTGAGAPAAGDIAAAAGAANIEDLLAEMGW